MDLQDFIRKIAEQFEDTNASEFGAATEFMSLVDWSSMVALSIIAMIDEEYGVTIKGDDLGKSQTVEDLFNVAKKYKFQG